MVVFALYMCALLALGSAHIYERCELARELSSLGVDKDQIATWVCIAFHESRFDTAARNPHSGDHGLLQISELYWCGPGKACGLPCSDLRDEDISDDVQCAHRIYKEHTRLQGDGFLAWVVYQHHCKNNAKKYLVDCEGHLKNATDKSDNRGRRPLRTGRFKDTTARPFYLNHPDIDKLKTPFLAINLFLDGRYGKQLKDDYDSDNRRTNWINYKIDNIDSLKLPENGLHFTTSSTTTTTNRPRTTTIDPDLIGIKPPMPRRIETNQFRRKMNSNRSNNNQIITDDNYKVINETPQNIFIENGYSLPVYPKVLVEAQGENNRYNLITNQSHSVKAENRFTTSNPFLFASNVHTTSTLQVPIENKFWQTTISPMTTFTDRTLYTNALQSTVIPKAQLSLSDINHRNLQSIEKSNSSDKQTSVVKSESVQLSNMTTTNFNRRFRPFFTNSYDWTTTTMSTKILADTTKAPIKTALPVNNISDSAARNSYYTTARPLLFSNSYQIQTSQTPTKMRSNITNSYAVNNYFSTNTPIITTYNVPTTTTASKIPSNLNNIVDRNYYFTTPIPTSNNYNIPTSTLRTETQRNTAYNTKNNYFTTPNPFLTKSSYNVSVLNSTTKPQSSFSNNFARNYYFTTPKPFSASETYNVSSNTTSTKIQSMFSNAYYFTTAKPSITTIKDIIQKNITDQITKDSQSKSGQDWKGTILKNNHTNVTDTKSNISSVTSKSYEYSSDVYTSRPAANTVTAKPQSSTWSWRRLSSSNTLPERTTTSSLPLTSTTTSTTSYSTSRPAIKTQSTLFASPKIEQESSPETTTTKKPSIFDLYLHPQKPKFVPFQFTPLKGSRKLLIFSGGTTAPPNVLNLSATGS